MGEMPTTEYTEYTEYVEPVNYFQSVIFALLGGLVGVAIWLAPVYFANYVYYITIFFVGVFAAFGARGFNRKKGSFVFAIIAVLATLLCVVIGDLAETAIVYDGFSIRFEDYFEYLDLKFSGEGEQLFYYAATIIASAFFAWTPLNQTS